MKYDFNEDISRLNTGSVKWDCQENELPMWIADMDLPTSEVVQNALLKRAAHPIYGYTNVENEWYDAYINYFKEKHNFEIKKEWMAFCLGVVPTISSTVRKLTSIGDNVVVLSPVYNIFYNSIINNQRTILQVPLLYENDRYEIDWSSLEKALKEEKTTLLIFCNPANPISKIWNEEELAKLGQLCFENHVVVLSDEIHCEITRPGKDYIPFARVNEVNQNLSVTAISPTKTFNIAGLQTSAIVIPNRELRKKVIRQINTDEVAEPNVFACEAAIAAYNDGREYIEELRKHIFSNRDEAISYINKEIPMLHVIDGDATYLLWINIEKLSCGSEKFVSFLRKETGLILNPGLEYGGNGDSFVRMNVACSKNRLHDGLNRLKKGVQLFLEKKHS